MSIIKALLHTFSRDILRIGSEALKPFECDGLSIYRQKPLAVVLVENIEQAKQVLKICKIHQTPVVTRGAGTGLSGGALPLENSVVLGLSKLNRILSIDHIARTAWVEPGVRNIAISEAVAPYHLYYAPDPSSQVICSIGGNVAENSGGVHCLKYGLTVNNVHALSFLNSDAQEITLTDSDEGLDLLALMNGSEGLLGVITKICVRLLPKPEHAQIIVAGFNSVSVCADAVSAIIRAGIIPAGLEMMDAFAIKAAESFTQVGYPLDVAALLLCELDGSNEQIKVNKNTVLKLFKSMQVPYIRISKSDEERLALWRGRKSAFPAVGRLAPDYYCMDGTIPRAKLAYALDKISMLSKDYNLAVANVFHAGDGNLHPLILYDGNKAGEIKRVEEFGTKILNLCIQLGGTITGEHGVGIEKIDSMCTQFSVAELDIFHQIKAAFDPNNLLNPGKAVPTLSRCAELGQMHVHHNRLPFANLDRF